jgi:hypothetical protein
VKTITQGYSLEVSRSRSSKSGAFLLFISNKLHLQFCFVADSRLFSAFENWLPRLSAVFVLFGTPATPSPAGRSPRVKSGERRLGTGLLRGKNPAGGVISNGEISPSVYCTSPY